MRIALIIMFFSTTVWAAVITESVTSEANAERLKPIGEVTADGAVAAKPSVTVSIGQKTYETYCHACHGSGVAGAPKYGDKAAWASRIAQGKDVLVAHAIKGIRAMPPKGTCMDCSDADITETVDYMLKTVK